MLPKFTDNRAEFLSQLQTQAKAFGQKAHQLASDHKYELTALGSFLAPATLAWTNFHTGPALLMATISSVMIGRGAGIAAVRTSRQKLQKIAPIIPGIGILVWSGAIELAESPYFSVPSTLQTSVNQSCWLPGTSSTLDKEGKPYTSPAQGTPYTVTMNDVTSTDTTRTSFGAKPETTRSQSHAATYTVSTPYSNFWTPNGTSTQTFATASRPGLYQVDTARLNCADAAMPR